MFKNLTSAVSDLAGKASEQSVAIIRATAEEFNAVRPLFARVGYRVTKVQLEIALSPKIMFQLCHFADVKDAEFEALLAEHKGNKVLSSVVAALRQASQLQAKVKFQGMRFTEVEVELGIPPAVKLTFMEQKEEGVAALVSATVSAVTGAVVPPPLPSPAPLPLLVKEYDEESERQRREDIETLIRAGRAIRFSCVGCARSLVVRAREAGREGECRYCGTPQVIPSPEGLDLD